jgi:hypothetical protein
MRLEEADDDRAGLQLRNLLEIQWRNRQQHIGLRQHGSLAG